MVNVTTPLVNITMVPGLELLETLFGVGSQAELWQKVLWARGIGAKTAIFSHGVGGKQDVLLFQFRVETASRTPTACWSTLTHAKPKNLPNEGSRTPRKIAPFEPGSPVGCIGEGKGCPPGGRISQPDHTNPRNYCQGAIDRQDRSVIEHTQPLANLFPRMVDTLSTMICEGFFRPFSAVGLIATRTIRRQQSSLALSSKTVTEGCALKRSD